jgi:hypothetical protein
VNAVIAAYVAWKCLLTACAESLLNLHKWSELALKSLLTLHIALTEEFYNVKQSFLVYRPIIPKKMYAGARGQKNIRFKM